VVLNAGGNLQNIPRDNAIRKLFIPDPGKVFIEADLTQAEARVVAYLADDARMIKLFESGGDIHKLNASFLYDKSVDMVTKEERQFAKSHTHAFNYGETARGFARLARITESEAKRIRDTYFKNAPRVLHYHMGIENQFKGGNRTLTTPFGRSRRFYAPLSSQVLKEAYAYIPQSTVADCLNTALIRLRGALENRTFADILMQVHDSIVLQCVPSHVPSLMCLFREAFNIPVNIGIHTFTIPFDVKVGKNWGEMEELGNG